MEIEPMYRALQVHYRRPLYLSEGQRIVTAIRDHSRSPADSRLRRHGSRISRRDADRQISHHWFTPTGVTDGQSNPPSRVECGKRLIPRGVRIGVRHSTTTAGRTR